MLNAFKAVDCIITIIPFSTPIASLTREFLNAQGTCEALSSPSAAMIATSITGSSASRFIIA